MKNCDPFEFGPAFAIDQGGPIGSESDRKSDPIGIGSVIGRTGQQKFFLVRSVKSDPIGKIGSENPIGKWVKKSVPFIQKPLKFDTLT